MRFQCSQCENTLDTSTISNGVIVCSQCGAKLKPPGSAMGKPKPAAGGPKPIILPVVMPAGEAPELTEEKIKDLQESRKQRGEDRAGNGIGAAGFAIGLATLLFLFSAAAVRKDLAIYLVFATCLSVPTSLIALVCSVIGCLRKGRPKLFSFAGVLIAAFLLVAAIPGAMMAIKKGE